MKAILSHLFAGVVYWWSAQQIGNLSEDVRSKRPHHQYYRTLYADVDNNLDVALACAVVFEEVLLPAADAPLTSAGTGNSEAISELDVKASGWELHRAVQDAIRGETVKELVRATR